VGNFHSDCGSFREIGQPQFLVIFFGLKQLKNAITTIVIASEKFYYCLQLVSENNAEKAQDIHYTVHKSVG